MSNGTYQNFIKVAADSGIHPYDAAVIFKTKLADDMGGMAQPTQAGIPPELEQLIHSLPPEVIQQLIAELEQQMAAQQQMPKQASFNDALIKQADYVDGFIAAAKNRGFNNQEIADIYKSACDLVIPDVVFQQKVAALDEQSRRHLEGFVAQSNTLGLNPKQAADVYFSAVNQ